RLERRQTEAFVQRWEDKHGGQAIERRQRVIRKKPEEAHVLVQLVAVHGAPQRRQLRDFVSDDEQFQFLEASLPQFGERLDQSYEVFVGLDSSDVQDEALIELETFADTRDLLGRRLHPEPFIDGVVDDRDLLRRHAEEMQDVAL